MSLIINFVAIRTNDLFIPFETAGSNFSLKHGSILSQQMMSSKIVGPCHGQTIWELNKGYRAIIIQVIKGKTHIDKGDYWPDLDLICISVLVALNKKRMKN